MKYITALLTPPSSGSGGSSLGTEVFSETPTGLVNGSNSVFTLAHTPVTGTVLVFLNGMLQDAGGNDYAISGSTITFVNAPTAGERIRVTYFY